MPFRPPAWARRSGPSIHINEWQVPGRPEVAEWPEVGLCRRDAASGWLPAWVGDVSSTARKQDGGLGSECSGGASVSVVSQ
jgi:hypothetical protein